MTDPGEVVGRLRSLAREVGMTQTKLRTLVRTTWRNGGTARGAAGDAQASATVTRDMVPQLACWFGVEIEISGVAGEVGVYPTLRDGRVIAAKVVVGPSATVGDVLGHRDIVKMLKRMSECDAVLSGAHEAIAEVRKYEAMIVRRMKAMITQLRHGDESEASRMEDEILVMASELLYWRGVLDEMKRTGDWKCARGLIEARDIGKVTADAIAAGYPELPNGYYYRRWPGRGPEGQEYWVYRARANGAAPLLQLRRSDNGWVLKSTEDPVLTSTLTENQSLRAYVKALTDVHGIGLPEPVVQARMRHVIERMRTPPNATRAKVAASARRRLRALKAEFHEEFFACAAREPTPEAQLARFLALIQDLNIADRGKLLEDFLARRDPGSVQRVVVKRTEHPRLSLSARKRYIDRVLADGTAVEVKSITGKLSPNGLAQFEDYKRIRGSKITVLGKPMRIERVMYEFTEAAGVRANLKIIEEQMLGQGIWVKVYNRHGQYRILKKEEDLVGIEEWLAH